MQMNEQSMSFVCDHKIFIASLKSSKFSTEDEGLSERIVSVPSSINIDAALDRFKYFIGSFQGSLQERWKLSKQCYYFR